MHVYRDAKMYDKAIEGWQRFKQLYPDPTDEVPDRLTLRIRAEKAREEKNYPLARQLFHELTAKFPQTERDTEIELGMIDLLEMEDQDRLKEAFDGWEKLWERNKIILPYATQARERILKKMQQQGK